MISYRYFKTVLSLWVLCTIKFSILWYYLSKQRMQTVVYSLLLFHFKMQCTNLVKIFIVNNIILEVSKYNILFHKKYLPIVPLLSTQTNRILIITAAVRAMVVSLGSPHLCTAYSVGDMLAWKQEIISHRVGLFSSSDHQIRT